MWRRAPDGIPSLMMVLALGLAIGDVDNTDDDTNYGAVAYEYKIAKFEVTNSEYCDFLNDVADDDTHELYHPDMNSSAQGGIMRSDSSPNYTYSVKIGKGDNPVNFVHWR